MLSQQINNQAKLARRRLHKKKKKPETVQQESMNSTECKPIL